VSGVRNEWHVFSDNLSCEFEIDKNDLACENLGCHPNPGFFGKEAVGVPAYFPTDS
jgi:hypothetical protein